MCKSCSQTGTALLISHIFKTCNKMNALINLLEHWFLAAATAVIFFKWNIWKLKCKQTPHYQKSLPHLKRTLGCIVQTHQSLPTSQLPGWLWSQQDGMCMSFEDALENHVKKCYKYSKNVLWNVINTVKCREQGGTNIGSAGYKAHAYLICITHMHWSASLDVCWCILDC